MRRLAPNGLAVVVVGACANGDGGDGGDDGLSGGSDTSSVGVGDVMLEVAVAMRAASVGRCCPYLLHTINRRRRDLERCDIIFGTGVGDMVVGAAAHALYVAEEGRRCGRLLRRLVWLLRDRGVSRWLS